METSTATQEALVMAGARTPTPVTIYSTTGCPNAYSNPDNCEFTHAYPNPYLFNRDKHIPIHCNSRAHLRSDNGQSALSWWERPSSESDSEASSSRTREDERANSHLNPTFVSYSAF